MTTPLKNNTQITNRLGWERSPQCEKVINKTLFFPKGARSVRKNGSGQILVGTERDVGFCFKKSFIRGIKDEDVSNSKENNFSKTYGDCYTPILKERRKIYGGTKKEGKEKTRSSMRKSEERKDGEESKRVMSKEAIVERESKKSDDRENTVSIVSKGVNRECDFLVTTRCYTIGARTSGVKSKKNTSPSTPRKKGVKRKVSKNNKGRRGEGGNGSGVNVSDRFIPLRQNYSTCKLVTTIISPSASSSPKTHVRAQCFRIYQNHVAEACGLKVNLRVLYYQPNDSNKKNISNFLGYMGGNFENNSNNGDIIINPTVLSKRIKKIPMVPERVLDAPGLVDDFYLNLLAWSLINLLAIGLEDSVYIWNATTGAVKLLCNLPNKMLVTSLRWSSDGSFISIGKEDGFIEIWDVSSNTKLRTLNCGDHKTRIVAQSWFQNMLTTGSKIGSIYHTDVRLSSHYIKKLENFHDAEVCGIEHKFDGQIFLSGGNDNLVCIWDIRHCYSLINPNNLHELRNGNRNSTSNIVAQPLFTKTNHKAAVKAISWCPYISTHLATGGGLDDKTINFWNTSTGAHINKVETTSQISSLNWGYASGIGMEVVATHGFPTNNISLINYPTLQKTGEIISAHESRILSGCLSPDNLTLATIAGDENLKFWSLFDLYKPSRCNNPSETFNNDNKKESLFFLTNGNDQKMMKKMMNIR